MDFFQRRSAEGGITAKYRGGHASFGDRENVGAGAFYGTIPDNDSDCTDCCGSAVPPGQDHLSDVSKVL